MTSIDEVGRHLARLSPKQRDWLARGWVQREEHDRVAAWEDWRTAWQMLDDGARAGYWAAEACAWAAAGGEAWGQPGDQRWWGWPDAWVPVARALLALSAGSRIGRGAYLRLIRDLAGLVPGLAEAGWPGGLGVAQRPPASLVAERIRVAHLVKTEEGK